MQASNTWFHRAVLALLALWLAGAAPAHADAPIGEGLALHLLNRLGYGPAPGEVARVRAMGVQAFVDSQLAAPHLAQAARADLPADEEALLHAIASPRQLEAVLAAFWQDWFKLGQDGQMALRPYVLGRYAVLKAHAREAAPEGSEAEALRALAAHFVSAPSPGLLRSLKRVWDTSGGDQRAVLRALFTSREFLAPAQWGTKRKDAFRFIVSALRASGLAVENVAPLAEFTRRPIGEALRTDFVERLAGGQLALAMAPVRPHQYASSAPPMRAGDASAGRVAQPGPVLMAAPTPSAAAMAAAARSRPAEPERLRALLRSDDFQRY